MRSGVCSARPRSVRPIGGSGSSSWPTANAADWKGSSQPGQRRRQLSEAVEARWPTATSQDAKASGAAAYSTESGRHAGTTLTDAACRPWATPTSHVRSHTPRKVDHGIQLANQVVDFPSGPPAQPTTGQESLPSSSRQWATPRSGKSAIYAEAKETQESRKGREMGNLADQACNYDTKKRLNPRFVEWLMGLPAGWTSFEPLGTEWSRWLRLMRSEL